MFRKSSGYRAAVIAAVLLLPACSFTEDALWPSLTGEDPKGAPEATQSEQEAQAPVLATPATAQPALGTTNFQPEGVTSGTASGTFVGKKVVELRSELKRLQGSISQHNATLQQVRATIVQNSQRYHGTVAAINTRLQVGTTPGNPILVQQFNNARGNLEQISNDTGELNRLATAVSADSTMSAFLSESTRAAFSVSGAVDEDHKQLAILEDEVNRTVVLIERLLKELAEDVRRQTNYVATERSNLNLLSAGIKGGEIFGASLANQAIVSAAGNSIFQGPARAQDTTGRRPLVVIRFDRPDIPYQQALYAAVSRVLERRPDAVFDLVAVAPGAGGPARIALNSNKAQRFAEGVLRSLIEMGLPPSRVAMSGKTSAQTKSNEVHLYLR
ncbi:MAG: hypothetical protein HOL66_11605 [Rhodospirillaceae bacterium]|nr:hypothetical protein [Rhodospirillaceae bacterium]MBT5244876.1 hypothetical protein [Rhodospirillaceae bacterium]MBT5562734.1 hypothetical protein [Rhodospirillaceae bacterium]MBT7138094.1 hypothetical protein [Rhodospirillaceae bacterium]